MTEPTYTPTLRRALMVLGAEWKTSPTRADHTQCQALAQHHPALCERQRAPAYSFYRWSWRLTPAGLAEQARLRSVNPC